MSILPPLCLALLGGAQEPAADLPRVLFLTHSAGYTHGVVRRPAPDQFAHAERCLMEAAEGRLEIVPTQDCARINAKELEGFDAVLFYTTGELPIAGEDRAALMEWIRDEGAFAGVHSATDTLYQYPPYVALIGGLFDGHPWHQDVKMRIEAPGHPAMEGLGSDFGIKDEIYQFRAFRRHPVRVLMSLDVSSIEVERGKRADRDYAVAWCKDHGRGRVFYTALGHRPEVWSDPRFQEHLVRGLEWAHSGPEHSPAPPEGAEVLFGGSELDGWQHRGGAAARWTVADGAFQVAPGTGNLVTRAELGSGLYHVEFMVPVTPAENGWQDRGNSGVYVQGRYEVQVLDSLGRELRSGDCGGIYGKHVASVDACREAGRWQSYDIRFQAPVFDDAAQKTANARMSVWHNGILIHDDVEVDGTTAAAMASDERSKGPLMLQDHGHGVRYRNVWFLPGDV